MIQRVTIFEETPGAVYKFYTYSIGVEKVKMTSRKVAWSIPRVQTFYFPDVDAAKAWARVCGFGYTVDPHAP